MIFINFLWAGDCHSEHEYYANQDGNGEFVKESRNYINVSRTELLEFVRNYNILHSETRFRRKVEEHIARQRPAIQACLIQRNGHYETGTPQNRFCYQLSFNELVARQSPSIYGLLVSHQQNEFRRIGLTPPFPVCPFEPRITTVSFHGNDPQSDEHVVDFAGFRESPLHRPPIPIPSPAVPAE